MSQGSFYPEIRFPVGQKVQFLIVPMSKYLHNTKKNETITISYLESIQCFEDLSTFFTRQITLRVALLGPT